MVLYELKYAQHNWYSPERKVDYICIQICRSGVKYLIWIVQGDPKRSQIIFFFRILVINTGQLSIRDVFFTKHQ